MESAVRALYVDQWPTPGTRRPQATAGRATGPGPLSTTTSPDEAETGVRARRKLASLLMGRLKTDRAQFISDKSGVSITSDPQFVNGKLSLCVEGTYEYSVNLNVTNTGTEPVYFTYYSPLTRLRYLSLTDEHNVTKSNPLTLRPGDSCDVQLHFHCSWVGIYPATLAFEFTPDLQTSSAAFHIVRFIEAQCITSLGLELAPVAPFRPRSLPAWTPTATSTIVDGQRPEGMSLMQLKNVLDLKKYAIPPYVNQLVNALKSSLPHNRRALLQSPLSWENYAEKFQLLLFLEELQMVVDMKRYNIPNDDKEEHAVMTRDAKNKKLLVLEVPGVAENRPSVLRGDELLVRPAGETGVKYRGYVHSVELNRVKLGFSSELLSRFYEGMKFSVEFTVNRLTLRLQHRAAELVEEHGLEELLFPAAPSSSAQQPELPNLSLFDWKLERNEEQFRAVKHIVAGSSRPAPYLVFGPPGTGKTVTLVEAIKQIEKTQASCRILACAPSNSAADLLCKKILDHVDDFKVFRMYASSRDPKMVPEELKACSNLVGDCYLYPPKEKLMEYRVVVTTLLTAGRLVSGGVPTGHYTHVFVDEAGHAVETECLVPLAGLLHVQTGQVVLAGDPEQLGPIIRSPFCQKYGLERYRTLSQQNVTELCHNRTLQNFVIQSCTSSVYIFLIGSTNYCEYSIKRLIEYVRLLSQGFPLIFHGVTGVDERESSSPSFFNRAEVEVLMDYVKKLLQTHGKKGLATIAPRDIGIIAPYRKQVQKIRQALNKVEKDLNIVNMKTLKVTERFTRKPTLETLSGQLVPVGG
ncbi:putative helicase mov-10-B.2 [Scophthalmus maximus]|uniref:RNA helicase n=1 Tax=Scophthalmus maximus TaxID=52904 RepID=A0A2U9BUL1_SCOMX|nr:putative helicase mov-10-B.2 [Scophthalmus maximus]